MPLIFAELLPVAPPVIPPVTIGNPHVYVVPAGTIVAGVGTPFDGAAENVPPLQIVAVWFGITGVGFTVIVTVNDGPLQVPAAPEVGVTV